MLGLMEIGKRIENLTKIYNKEIINADRGLSNTELYIIVELSRFDGETDNDILLKATYFTKQMLSKYLGQLTEKGLIESVQLENNLKKKHVRLTEEGRLLSTSLVKAMVDFESFVCSRYTPEEYTRLGNYCRRVFENIRLYKSIQCIPMGGWPPVMHYIIKIYKLGIYFVEKLDHTYDLDLLQRNILMELYLEEELKFKMLESRTCANQTAIVRATKKLEVAGYIETDTDLVDKRVKLARLTASGKMLVKQAIDTAEKEQNRCLNGLTPIQRKEFIRLLNIMLEQTESFSFNKVE